MLLVSAKLFGYNTRGNYPIIFDKICESLLNDSDISYRCATAVIELLENVATDKNRARYETMLYKLKNLDDRRVSERASDLIMHLFGTI